MSWVGIYYLPVGPPSPFMYEAKQTYAHTFIIALSLGHLDWHTMQTSGITLWPDFMALYPLVIGVKGTKTGHIANQVSDEFIFSLSPLIVVIFAHAASILFCLFYLFFSSLPPFPSLLCHGKQNAKLLRGGGGTRAANQIKRQPRRKVPLFSSFFFSTINKCAPCFLPFLCSQWRKKKEEEGKG